MTGNNFVKLREVFLKVWKNISENVQIYFENFQKKKNQKIGKF